jgi:sulfite exporter TauE/SafE
METNQQQKKAAWLLLLGYNLGRLSSYVFAGFFVGLLGAVTLGLAGMEQLRIVFQLLAALVLLALGLYLGGWWFGLARVEQFGGHWWRRIEPLGRQLIPVRTFSDALIVGAIWGWLPCGLIYSVLIWALTAADPIVGAGLMLSFGLGTLPNLLLMGLLANVIRPWLQKPMLRKLAGASVIALAIWQVYLALRLW